MQTALTTLPPKMLRLSSSAELPQEIKPKAGDLASRVSSVKARFGKAIFTTKSDAEVVPTLYENYVKRIAEVLATTLSIATEAPAVQLPPMPASDASTKELRTWHIECLRAQHATIPDALSGKRLNTLRDCVPIAITGKDMKGEPLANVRDAAGIATWFKQLPGGEGALVTAEPAAGKSWLLSQVLVRCLDDSSAERLPILVKVEQLQTRWKEVAQDNDWLGAYLQLTVRDDASHYATMLRTTLSEKRALLLIDGLDEAGALRSEIERSVAGLAAHGHVLLCTSRPAGLDESLFATFHRLQLSRLSNAQQLHFLETRLGNKRATELRPYLREKVPVDELRRRVTSNPLMLSMVASIAELRAGIEMPTTTAELYEVAADLLLSRAGKPSDAALTLMRATFFEAHKDQQRVITDKHLQAAAAYLSSSRSTVDELHTLVTSDRLPLLRLLQSEPELQMQAFHLSFQEFYAMCALRDGDGDKLALPQFKWDVWWSNAVRMGVQTGDKFGAAFANAVGLPHVAESSSTETETWRARVVAGLGREGLPAAWLATVVEAARGNVTDAAQLKAFIGRHRDVLQHDGGSAVAQLALQEPIESALFDMLRKAPTQRLIEWRNKPTQTDPHVATLTHEAKVTVLAVSNTLLVGGSGKFAYVYDVTTEELLQKLEGTSDVKNVAIFEESNDEDEDERVGLIAVAYENGTLKIWDGGVSTDTVSITTQSVTTPCACGSILGAQSGEAERP